MGDKKSKKVKAKDHRQTDARHAKAAMQKQKKQHPLTTGTFVGHAATAARGRIPSARRMNTGG